MKNRLLPFATLVAASLLAPVRVGLADDAGLTDAARAVGSRLFATHCASCHGADGSGGPG